MAEAEASVLKVEQEEAAVRDPSAEREVGAEVLNVEQVVAAEAGVLTPEE